eukprot:14074850-Alexandrium_andersonii.AAC.1
MSLPMTPGVGAPVARTPACAAAFQAGLPCLPRRCARRAPFSRKSNWYALRYRHQLPLHSFPRLPEL